MREAIPAAKTPGAAPPEEALRGDSQSREALLARMHEVWADIDSLRRGAGSDLGPPPLLRYEVAALEARIAACRRGAPLGDVRACLRACETYLGHLRSLERAGRSRGPFTPDA